MNITKLKPTSSFASEVTVGHNTTAISKGGTASSSPLAHEQKLAFPPSYIDNGSSTIAPSPQHKDEEPATFPKRAKSLALLLLKKYWFLLGLAFVIILAYAAPDVARKGGYIRAEWSIKWGAVIVIFLISGMSLRTRILTQTFLRIRLHLLVQIINLVIIPFFVFGLVLLLFKLHVPMNSLVLMGVVIAASTPTTVSSNVVMTKSAKGNEATALMNAALGNVLGIFISPVLVDTFQEPLIEATPENESAQAGGKVDFLSVLKQLGITVLIPLVVGQIIQLMFTEKVAEIKVKWRLSDVSSVCLLAMVWSVFCDAFNSKSFDSVGATDIIGVVIMNMGFYILFSFLCFFLAYIPFPSAIKEPSWVKRLRFSREDTVAVMYCGATKTVAMGVPLINVLYQNGDPGTVGVLSTPLLLYHVEQLILGNIEVDLLKRWVAWGKKKDESAEPPSRDEEDFASSSGPPPVETLANIPPTDDEDEKECSTKEITEATATVYYSEKHYETTKLETIQLDEIVPTSTTTVSIEDEKRSDANDSGLREVSSHGDFFTSPLFASETGSFTLDTSHFSTETTSSSHQSSPSPTQPHHHSHPQQP